MYLHGGLQILLIVEVYPVDVDSNMIIPYPGRVENKEDRCGQERNLFRLPLFVAVTSQQPCWAPNRDHGQRQHHPKDSICALSNFRLKGYPAPLNN